MNFWTPSKPLNIHWLLERSGDETFFWKCLKFQFPKLVHAIYVYKDISESNVLTQFPRNFNSFRWFPNHDSSEIPRIEYFSKSNVFSVSKFFRWRISRHVVSSDDFPVHLIQFCTPELLLSHQKLLASDLFVPKINEYWNYFVNQFTTDTKKYFNEIEKIVCHGVSANSVFSLFWNRIWSVRFEKPQSRKIESKCFFRSPPLFRSKYFRKHYEFHFFVFFSSKLADLNYGFLYVVFHEIKNFTKNLFWGIWRSR